MCCCDLTDRSLHTTQIQEIERLEIANFPLRCACTARCRLPARDVLVGGVLRAQWVVVRRFDEKPRSRPMAKDVKMYSAPEHFAAAASRGSLRYLWSCVAMDRNVHVMRVKVAPAHYEDTFRDARTQVLSKIRRVTTRICAGSVSRAWHTRRSGRKMRRDGCRR